MKTGFITKQEFEQRQRNYATADAAVRTMIARKDEAQSSIKSAEAKVQEIQSVIHDLTLVSPRNGQVQYLLAQKGETVAVGEPIATILDFTDLKMVIFLRAAEAGRVTIGDDARVILDAVPDYVIPAKVSFVAANSQFTPKTVETEDERAKLMFRIELRIDRDVLRRYYGKVDAGLKGAGFVLTKRDAKWPSELEVKLPPVPVAEAPSPTPIAQEPVSPTASPPPPPVPMPVAQAPAPAPVSQTAAPAPTPSPAEQASAPAANSAEAQKPSTVETPAAQVASPGPAPQAQGACARSCSCTCSAACRIPSGFKATGRSSGSGDGRAGFSWRA